MREDWKVMRLGDIASYINGFAFKPEDWSDKGLPIIRIQNLTENNGTFHYCQRKDIPSKYLVQKGDILISWSATLGVFEWILENALLNQHIFKVVFDKIEINKQYFKYAIHMSIDEMSRHTNGATMRHIRKGDFDNICIPVPPLSEQERIVALLDDQFAKIDALKANATSQLQAAKDLFQSALKEMLTPKEGWDEKVLGKICDILDSKRKPITKNKRISGTIPYYGATGILDYVKDFIFDEKLVLLGEDGAKWGTGENSAYIICGKSWVNNHAHALRPHRNIILDEFLVYYLNYSDLSESITGVTVPKLNQEKMRAIAVPIPSLPEQERIAARLDAISEKVKALQANYDQTITLCNDLKQSLLKSIFE